MRIRKFYEMTSDKLENETAERVIEDMEDFLAQMKDRQTSTDQMINILENYATPSDKSNDQVDDTIAALREVKKSVDATIDKLDTAIQNMRSYTDDGSEFLYSETKPKS